MFRLFALASLSACLVGCPQTTPKDAPSKSTSQQKRKPDARNAAIEKRVAGTTLEKTPPEERRVALRIASLMKAAHTNARRHRGAS
ncbi:MAG: hypothetical protein GY822_10815 [Deltaproteobacteria bacterium]|nr:hypothetical protein [Deltaproteobacteria bacterium]